MSLGLFAIANHLLNFAAPAAALAAVLAVIGVFLTQKKASARDLLAHAAINFAVGCAVLLLGLLALGSDGKMLTYGALALACGSSQWVLSRG